MNLDEASQHIGECISLLTTTNYPAMKVVVLIHSNNNDISMVSNFMEPKHIFEVLTRGMASCFDPIPKPEFKSACTKFLETIQPAVSALDNSSGVVCFWDDKIKSAALISSLQDYSVSFAIICEHMYRTIAGGDMIHYNELPENYLLH